MTTLSSPTAPRSRVITGVRLNNSARIYWRTTSTGSWSSVVLVAGSDTTPRVYYPSGGNEAFDLIAQMNARLTSASAPFSVGVELDPDSPHWGKLIVSTSQSYLQISPRGNGSATTYTDMLWRMIAPNLFRVSSFVWTNTGSGSRNVYMDEPMGGCLHLRRLVTHFRSQQAYQIAQGVADEGTTFHVCYGMTRRYAMLVSLSGALPRSLLWNEHAQMMSFLDACSRGFACIIYPNAVANYSYRRRSDQWRVDGWVFGMLRQESLVWTPDSPEWYQQWDKELVFDRLATAPLA